MRKRSPLAVPQVPALPARAEDVRLERRQCRASEFLHVPPVGTGRCYSAWEGIGSLHLRRRQFGVNMRKQGSSAKVVSCEIASISIFPLWVSRLTSLQRVKRNSSSFPKVLFQAVCRIRKIMLQFINSHWFYISKIFSTTTRVRQHEN